MSYAFSFTKKSLSLLLAGLAFVGIMLFTAGLLIGTNWKAEPDASANVARKQPAVAAPAPQPAATPQEPVMTADAVTTEAAAPTEADASSGVVASPGRQAHGKAASARRRREQTPQPAPPNDDELRVIQEAEPAASAQRSGGR